MAWVRVASTDDIEEGGSIAVDCGLHRIALFRLDGKFYAISDTCPHAGGPLSEGYVDGTEVVCPWHGWSFDLCAGPDANDGACRYTVEVEGAEIRVDVPE